MNNITILLAFLLFAPFAWAQPMEECTAPLKIDNDGQIGVLSTGESATFNIIQILSKQGDYAPIEELKEIQAILAVDIYAKEQRLQAREDSLNKRVAEIQLYGQQAKANQEALRKIKADYATQLDALKAEFEQMEQALKGKQNQWMQADYETAQNRILKAKGIIKSAECYATDYGKDIKTYSDQSGNLIYAFPIEKLINDPNYSIIDEPSDGFIRVKKYGMYGFLTESGKPFTEFKFQHAESFYKGYALV